MAWDRPMAELVELLLIEEKGYSPEEAKRLCTSYPNVMVNGIMGSTHPGPIAMALEMADAAATLPPNGPPHPH